MDSGGSNPRKAQAATSDREQSPDPVHTSIRMQSPTSISASRSVPSLTRYTQRLPRATGKWLTGIGVVVIAWPHATHRTATSERPENRHLLRDRTVDGIAAGRLYRTGARGRKEDRIP